MWQIGNILVVENSAQEYSRVKKKRFHIFKVRLYLKLEKNCDVNEILLMIKKYNEIQNSNNKMMKYQRMMSIYPSNSLRDNVFF